MSFHALLPLLLALVLLATPASLLAESVDFDEMPAMDDPAMSLTDEYAHLGLHFTLSGAIWSGRSEGDPGGWGLEGTTGASFLGIAAPVFNMAMRFDWPVADLSFDVARGEAGASGQLMVFGYRDNGFVEMVTAAFPAGVDDWIRIEMSEEVDIVVAIGFGSVPYGVDDVRWLGPLGDVVEEMEVTIDIRPGSDRNPVQVGARGVVPVILFGSDDFDVSELDPSTLGFGPGLARPAHSNGPHMGDHDGDGYVDMLVHMPVADSQIGTGDTEACLQGETWEGIALIGCDVVTPVGKGRD